MIVVAGEALIDLVGEPDGRYRAVPGGSPSNVAIGLARLGVPTHLLARIGAGRLGQIVRAHLTSNGVGLAHAVDAAEPTTLAVVSLDVAGQATYDFYVNGTADWGWSRDELPQPLPPGTAALCTGSLAVALEPGATVLTDLLDREHRRGDVTIVLDPNLRPALLGSRERTRARLEVQIARSDVVKVSTEDLAWLAPDADPREIAAAWLALGPTLVVVTDGAAGAVGLTRAGVEVAVPAQPVDIVDTVGAGDAFASGLLDGLRRQRLLGGTARARLASLDDTTLRDVITYAARVAALTCGRRGADPPTADELLHAGEA